MEAIGQWCGFVLAEQFPDLLFQRQDLRMTADM
jgi:hypothetical protein